MVFLQIALNIETNKRQLAADIYTKFKENFLREIPGAVSKKLLVRDEDVQVLHEFDTVENAKAYLASHLFNQDVVTALKPLLQNDPDIRIYVAA
ncbi:hypothetical protein ACO0LC_20160 [Undibacterium sp. JH2W]|uniref:hypothetical protein n=1 Tax=Undibacterium sp. JH2W TaxID=3413037 RepID=UPI003BF3C030